MAEVLTAFTEKVFPQASQVCMPHKKICGGEKHSEALKRITLGTKEDHFRNYLGELKSTGPHKMHLSMSRELANVTSHLIPGLINSSYRQHV